MRIASVSLTVMAFAAVIGSNVVLANPAQAAHCLYIAYHSNGARIADGAAIARNTRVACRRAKRRCERERARKIHRMGISPRGIQCRRE